MMQAQHVGDYDVGPFGARRGRIARLTLARTPHSSQAARPVSQMRGLTRLAVWCKLCLLVASSLAAPSSALAGCGPDVGPCELSAGTELGSYELALPAGAGPFGAVMFLHGHGGSGAGVMGMRAMVETLTSRGYAVIAPNGSMRPGSETRSWAFLPEFRAQSGARDDIAFLQSVLRDAAARFDIDPKASVLAGFSSGAFMVNYLACAAPESFVAYAPVSGGFWRPQPSGCVAPVALYHAHGWRDGVVPLEGRILGAGRFEQGDIWAGLALWRETNRCATDAPDRMWQDGALDLRQWDCAAPIRFELFPGGHKVPQGWAARVLDWVEALPGASPP